MPDSAYGRARRLGAEIPGDGRMKSTQSSKKWKGKPDVSGHFGIFGGRFVPETLMGALDQLTYAYKAVKRDKKFQSELEYYLRTYVGRPTPLYEARNLSNALGRNLRIFLKR